jgi:hypothetical protein
LIGDGQPQRSSRGATVRGKQIGSELRPLALVGALVCAG